MGGCQNLMPVLAQTAFFEFFCRLVFSKIVFRSGYFSAGFRQSLFTNGAFFSKNYRGFLRTQQFLFFSKIFGLFCAFRKFSLFRSVYLALLLVFSGKVSCWYNVRVIFNSLVSSILGSSSENSLLAVLRNQLFLPESCKMWKVLFLVF